jgi:hypothetical protein
VRLANLLLSLAILAPQPAAAGALRGVTECDLRRLATWHGSEAKAKRALRQAAKESSKVYDTPRGRMAEGVFYEVEAARKVPMACTFAEAGYAYADSVALASVWGTDPAGARAIAEQKIAQGWEDAVVWALEDARSGKIPESPSPEDEALNAFLTGDRYTYCDARLLAAAWQIDVYSAKISIGTKLQNRNVAGLEQALGPARSAAIARRDTCSFAETGYSYEDAERLARSWGTSVESAKARVSDMVLRGQNPAVRQMLGDAR